VEAGQRAGEVRNARQRGVVEGDSGHVVPEIIDRPKMWWPKGPNHNDISMTY
jgi:hypothetical protein